MENDMDFKELEENFKSIGLDGWLEEWDLRNIYNEVAKLNSDGIYFEVGVAHGKSMAVASLAAKDGVWVGGVDTINWQDRDENIQKILDIYGKKFDWKFIEEDSQRLTKMWNIGGISVLFIDGNHTYLGTLKDIASWIPFVNHGGIIMFDDYNEKTGVMQAVDEIIRFNDELYTDHKIDGEMYICRKR